MTIMLTGPQRTPDELGALHEMAGLLDAQLMNDGVAWLDVTALYRMAGWECCAQAMADVGIADAFGWPMKDLPA
jgi:hypothetical protein